MINKNIHALSFVAALCVLSAGNSHADDTEVFFSSAGATGLQEPNVLFMFDTSGSMTDFDGFDAPRIERMKSAMREVLKTAHNVNIGIGSFNGVYVGGSIHYPTSALDDDACVNGTCGQITESVRIREGNDDALESTTGSMVLDSTTLSFHQTGDPSGVVAAGSNTKIYQLGSGDDDVYQYADGSMKMDDGKLPFFDGAAPVKVGLRFTGVDIPQDATINSAYIQFYNEGSSKGDQHAAIRVVEDDYTPVFHETSNKISDLTLSTDAVEWPFIEFSETSNYPIQTTDITSLIADRIQKADWPMSNAMAFVFEISGPLLMDGDNQRFFRAYEDSSTYAPKLVVNFDAPAYTASGAEALGLRFTGLNVPQGAEILHADIEFVATSGTPTDLHTTITAQSIGHAPALTSTAGNITSRTRTTASVDWSPGEWTPEEAYASPNLKTVVQEVVNRTDWCGGNAMAFVYEGIGDRQVISRNLNSWHAPRLTVTYKPDSVDFDTTCISRNLTSNVATSGDDVMEAADGSITSVDSTLNTHIAGTAQTIGLRFNQVDIPNGTNIVGARLELSSRGFTAGDVEVSISGEATGDSAPFNVAVNQDVTNRTRTVSSKNWNIDEIDDGGLIESPDFAAVINEIVSSAGWIGGQAISIFLDPVSASGTRSILSADSDNEYAVRLVIDYQQSGTDLGGATVPLRTVRQELMGIVNNYVADGGTPLMDAYYESAAYMLGEEVKFGRKRGEQWKTWHRVSSESTYSGDPINNPTDCDAVNLNDPNCRTREITDPNATYNAPASPECRANQIVLLSDGEPTDTNSSSLIQTLAGVGSCAYRSNTSESCGLELAEWLHDTDHDTTQTGTQHIVTHTVGFNFSAPILKDMAAIGGGQFFEASSAAQLSSAFRNIIAIAADINTSFVAPSATVSQFNRLANRNDLYFAMFHPATETRWDGNLKRYQLNKSNGEITVVDALAQPVFDNSTGKIKATAKSYWTSPNADGGEVAAGGAASKLTLTRKLFTALDDGIAATPSLVTFAETNTDIDNAKLGIGAADADYRTDLLKWARGVDVLDFDEDGNVTEVRTQMGDPMHSSPSILNYAITNKESIVYVGTNEGFLHAINSDTGVEEFAFIPEELLPNLDAYFANTKPNKRPYGLDGGVTTWFNDDNDNLIVDGAENAYVVIGMRRGGRNYYAFDVSNPTNPSLAWTIKGGVGDFAELGQTWSKPTYTRIMNAGTLQEVLIFGGGYDSSNDIRNTRSNSDIMGRAIFIVNANTGALIEKIDTMDVSGMDYSIPSDLQVIDIDVDGLADMIFVGDMGGQVLRFDIDNFSTGSLSQAITGGVIADLATVGQKNNRRFYNAPDIALVSDDHGNDFLNIAIGSGWRAHPLNQKVEDRFYSIRDAAAFGPPRNISGDIEYTKVVENNLVNVTSSSARGDTSGNLANGWRFELPDAGEKTLSSSLTINGQILFTTYLPTVTSGDACSPAVGGGNIYAIDSLYGEATINQNHDGSEAGAAESPTLSDRSKRLNTPGIPPPISVLIPEVDQDSPVTLAGFEAIPNVDYGTLFNRTFWAEN